MRPNTNLFSLRLLAALSVTLPEMLIPHTTLGQTLTINVNAAANRHTISPQIYGVNYGSGTTALHALNTPLNRQGSDAETRYNWMLNATNVGSDWYFESVPYSNSPGAYYDTFIGQNRAASADSMVTVPMIGWVAKLGANRNSLSSYSIAKYGLQTGHDPNGFSDAGNGILKSTGKFVVNNDPNDANTPANSAFQKPWIQHLVTKWGKASAGGVRYYLMDNESSVWQQIHHDVQPVGATMEAIRDKIKDYAAMVKSVDPTAQVVGPEEWGWDGYFYSGYDQQYTQNHNYNGVFPDRAAHNNMDYMPWLLDQLRQAEKTAGMRLLDVFSLHFYPQSGEFGNDTSTNMQLLRNRSTRSLWDPTYTDQSWISDKVNLISRMRTWANTYYPGTKIALTEYSWGADNHINGATTQADILGILGREGVDMACRWMMPGVSTPTYKAIQMYRNYDGSSNTFGDTSVQATVPNPDTLSAFAALRTTDGALTIMVINKVSTVAHPTINLSGFASSGPAQVWQLTSSNAITKLSAVPVQNNSLTTNVPAQSITLFVVPPAVGDTAQYNFENGTQGWQGTGGMITGVAASSTVAFAGKMSLAVNFNGATAQKQFVTANAPSTPAGKTVTFHIWFPAGSKITSLQPYVLQGAKGNWAWTGNRQDTSALKAGAWNTITVTVPSNAVIPLDQLGVEFDTGGAWTGTCYIDSVGW